MRAITLTATELTDWLESKNGAVKEPFWDILSVNCDKFSSFEHEFLIGNNDFPGIVRVTALFVNREKLLDAGWKVSDFPHIVSDRAIYVTNIIFSLLHSDLHSRRTSSHFTSYLSSPQFSLKIDYPQRQDLKLAWNSLRRIAPKINSLTHKVAKDLELDLNKLQHACL